MSRRQPPFEITPDLLVRAYSIGLFPMAEDRDDPDAALGRARAARRVPARRAERFPKASPRRCARDVYRGDGRRRVPRGDGGLRRRATRPGSTTRSCGSIASCTRAGAPIRSRRARTANSSAASMASASARRSSARACFTAPATPRRWRWCIWWRGCGSAAIGCSTRSSSRRIWRASARVEISRAEYRRRLAAALDDEGAIRARFPNVRRCRARRRSTWRSGRHRTCDAGCAKGELHGGV